MIVNDLYCPACNTTRKDVRFPAGREPACARCGARMRQDWSHGHPPATDLHSPRFFDGLDTMCSSTRQAEATARRRAADWTDEQQSRGLPFRYTIDGVAGDKRGGARDVTRVEHKAFSFEGQTSKMSTAERRSR